MRKEKGNEKKKLNKKRLFIFITVVILIFIIIYKVIEIINYSPIKKDVTVEAGEKLNIKDFLNEDDIKATFKTKLSEKELKKLGTYEVIIEYKAKEYTCKVTVKDTKAPTATLKNVEVYVGDKITEEMFIDKYDDATDVKIAFKEDVSTDKKGEKKVTLIFTDTSNNSSEYSSTLKIIEDNEAPVFSGLDDISITVGGTVSYKSGVIVSDNHDSKVSYSVDSSNVNINKVGTYSVIYTAKDSSGNVAKKTRKIIVKAKSSSSINIDTVNALADDVLNSIITDSMSKYQKIKAIYNWVRSNIGYSDSSDKSSYIKGAYTGFKNRRGDCYVYFATSKVLLTRAGIDNKDIKKSDTSHSSHYWNLVNIGDGWYHFDTTPRKGGFDGFYLTNEKLMSYSKLHSNSHIYDPSLYPNIK